MPAWCPRRASPWPRPRAPHRSTTRPARRPGWATASVDMGPARLGPDQPQEFDDRRARTVDVGNPHLVLLGPDTAAVDIAELGPQAAGRVQRRHQRRVDHRRARQRGGASRLPGVGAGCRRDAGLRHGERGRRRRGPELGCRATRAAPCASAIRAACSRSRSGRTSAATDAPGRDRCARWRTSTSTRGCSLEQRVARDAHRAHLPGADHPGRRRLPGPDRRGGRRGARRAGATRGQRRGRRRGTGRAAARRARPGHLRRVGARRRRSPR